MDELLQRNNVKQEWVSEIGRDSSGSKLYLYGYSDSATIVEGRGKLTYVPAKPSSLAYLNEAGQWAVWFTPGEAHFAEWTRPAQHVRTDRGALHYLVETLDAGVLEIGTTDGRLKQSITGFDPLAIFYHAGKIYVFGVWPRGLHHGDEVRCQIFGEGQSAYELEHTVTIARFGWPVHIVDMDLSAERVVLGRGLDFRPYWLLFDFRTGTLQSIGRPSQFGVFLREDVLESARHVGLQFEGGPTSGQ